MPAPKDRPNTALIESNRSRVWTEDQRRRIGLSNSRRKWSKRARDRVSTWLRKKWQDPEYRESRSVLGVKRMKDRSYGNGLGKLCELDGDVLRSKIEYRFASFLKSIGLEYVYEPEPFVYLDRDGIKHRKVIDFYVPVFDTYFEVGMSGQDQETIELVSRQNGITILGV